MSSLASNVSLIVATLDLKVVQSVIGAIKKADAASTLSNGPLHLGPAAVYEPRQHLHPETKIESRHVIHPESRYENRPVHHPVEARNSEGLYSTSTTPVPSCGHKSPIEPPWKTLPWPQTVHVTSKVKLWVHRSDLQSKGSLIDCMM